MVVGPIQALVIGFPDNDRLQGRVAQELEALSEIGLIRIIDAVFVLRDGEELVSLRVTDLDDDQRAELRAAVSALVGLGVAGPEGAVVGAEAGAGMDPDVSVSEILADAIGEDLADHTSALVLAVEHLWAVPLRDAVRDAGGVVLSNTSLTAEDLVGLGLSIGDAVEEELEAEEELGAEEASAKD